MSLQSKLAQVPEAFLDLLFPRRCLGCGVEGEFLCASCADTLEPVEPPYCARCGIPLKDRDTCPKCLQGGFQIEGIRSVFLHHGVAREAVHALKYERLKSVARPLAGLMAEYLQRNPLPADRLVAVPMHPRRMRQRGYNQAHLLARELGRQLQIPAPEGQLRRRRHTPSQVSLGAEERRANMAEAFCVRGDGLRGCRVLLIDDVCTTGATLNACAAALRKGGAASVWGLTFSRES